MENEIKELELQLKKLKKQKADKEKKIELKEQIKKLENEHKPITKLKKIGKGLWDKI